MPTRTNDPTGPAPPAAHLQHLTFRSGDGLYATDIRAVREIIGHADLSTVPEMPPFVRGVIELRGAVVPVLDLSARLRGVPTPGGREVCIVVYEVCDDRGWHDFGVLVDAVVDVRELDASAIQPAPAVGPYAPPRSIAGMARIDERLAFVLNVGGLLSTDEIACLAGLEVAG